jgi:biotin-(acetyl-CoA carboxylase) ligase
MPVALIEGEQVSQVVALGVTERGELIVKDAEQTRLVQAGEVSLRV